MLILLIYFRDLWWNQLQFQLCMSSTNTEHVIEKRKPCDRRRKTESCLSATYDSEKVWCEKWGQTGKWLTSTCLQLNLKHNPHLYTETHSHCLIRCCAKKSDGETFCCQCHFGVMKISLLSAIETVLLSLPHFSI